MNQACYATEGCFVRKKGKIVESVSRPFDKKRRQALPTDASISTRHKYAAQMVTERTAEYSETTSPLRATIRIEYTLPDFKPVMVASVAFAPTVSVSHLLPFILYSIR